MKTSHLILLFILLFVGLQGNSQISRQLQDALNQVPVVDYAYPANRDRNQLPPVEGPRAYLYAYANLPYAINLGSDQDETTGGIVEKVIINFQSVRISPGEERRILKNAVIDLQDILDQQGYQTRIAGFNAHTHFSRSMISRYFADGAVMRAIREMMCTQDLIGKLATRYSYLSN